MKKILVGILFCWINSFVSAQTIAKQVEHLSPSAYNEYIKSNFYSIRSQNMDTGLVYIERSLFIARDMQDKQHEAWCNMQKGIIHYLKGDYPKALSAYQRGLRLSEKINDDALTGNILKELGNYTKQQKEYKKAHEYLARSEKLCGKAGDSLCLASAYSLRGVVYQFENNLDSADIKYQAAFDLKKRLNDTLGLAYSYDDLAGIAQLRGQFERAIQLIEKSTDIRTQLNDNQGIAINLNNIGEVYLEQKNYLKAIDFFKESLILSRQLKFTDLIRHTLKLASQASLAIGDYKTAYTFLNESLALNDSLYSIEKAAAISEMQTKYETEKQSEQIKTQQVLIRQQQLIGITALSLLFLIGAIIYYRFYQRRKYEAQIQILTVSEKLQSERARISRDLHDNVGASLTSIITKLDVIAYKARKIDLPNFSDSLEKVNDGARKTMQQLRETIWAIKKDSYTIAEFSKKIKAYLQKQLEEFTDLKWKVTLEGNIEQRLSPNQVLNIFRIVQEAVQNTIKYAAASEILITIECDKYLSIKIKDNGKGMNLNTLELDEHYGLENMRFRANDLNGNFEIKSEEGKGVEIVFLINSLE